MIELTSLAPADLPQALLDHLPAAAAVAQANADELRRRHGHELNQISHQAHVVRLKPSDTKTKLVRLRFLSSQWSELATKHSACRKGCSHCCHVMVSLSRSEAQLIASKIGATIRADAGAPLAFTSEEELETITGTPCPFLKDGSCSIYEHRPLACRTLVNLDATDKLCQLVPGVQVPVPYADSTVLKGVYAMATLKEHHADIREWFGPGSAPDNSKG